MPYTGMSEYDQLVWLDKYGHFRNPAFPDTHNVQFADLKNLSLDHKLGQMAVYSFQGTDINCEHQAMATHGRALNIDGVMGPAVAHVMEMPRCGHPDFGKLSEASVEEVGETHGDDDIAQAVGVGNWKRCHNVGEYHRAVVRITNSPPAHLRQPYKNGTVFDEVLRRTRFLAYGEVGLDFVFYQQGQNAPAGHQIDFSFVGSSSGWIGLAIIGTNRTCTTTPIWCRYLSSYRGGSSVEAIIAQWTTLIVHELGHNCGFGHTRGGKMNPSLVTGLPASWRGDVLWPRLVQHYGGERVPVDGGDIPDGDIPANTVWDWRQSLEFADGKEYEYRMQMEGPMFPGAGYGQFTGNWGKNGPPIRQRIFIQPDFAATTEGEDVCEDVPTV